MTTNDDDGVIGELEEARTHIVRAAERARTGELSPELMPQMAPLVAALHDLIAGLVRAVFARVYPPSDRHL